MTDTEGTKDNHEWPDTLYCLRIKPNSPALDEHITTQLDDWGDRDTGTLEVVDSREYVRADRLQGLVEQFRERGDFDEHGAGNDTAAAIARQDADELEGLIEDGE